MSWFLRTLRLGIGAMGLLGVAACGGGGSQTGPTPPPTPTGVTLTSLTLNPSTATGCTPSQITATLSGAAPAGGATVTLTSGNTTAVTVPASIAIAAGATSGTATATPATVTAATAVSISGALVASAGTSASTQSASLNLGPPIANFSVSGTARGSNACQLLNPGGQVDCTFNGAASTGASRWSWTWLVGPNQGTGESTSPTFQPTTGCGLFANAPVMGTTGNTFLQMIVRLTVLDATSARSCVTQNVDVRVFSNGNCGGF
jgi:hypothetical protein